MPTARSSPHARGDTPRCEPLRRTVTGSALCRLLTSPKLRLPLRRSRLLCVRLRQLRIELENFAEEALDWQPAAGAGSIATIVTHLVSSKGKETLRCVAGVASGRDRDAESLERELSMDQVLALVTAPMLWSLSWNLRSTRAGFSPCSPRRPFRPARCGQG